MAYRRLAILHHPDKGGTSYFFRKVQEAYETLKTSEDQQSGQANADKARSGEQQQAKAERDRQAQQQATAERDRQAQQRQERLAAERAMHARREAHEQRIRARRLREAGVQSGDGIPFHELYMRTSRKRGRWR